MYQAMCTCQTLHPDPNDSASDEGKNQTEISPVTMSKLAILMDSFIITVITVCSMEICRIHLLSEVMPYFVWETHNQSTLKCPENALRKCWIRVGVLAEIEEFSNLPVILFYLSCNLRKITIIALQDELAVVIQLLISSSLVGDRRRGTVLRGRRRGSISPQRRRSTGAPATWQPADGRRRRHADEWGAQRWASRGRRAFICDQCSSVPIGLGEWDHQLCKFSAPTRKLVAHTLANNY